MIGKNPEVTISDFNFSSARPLVVVMGVSGCGKSTIGTLLADALGIPFVDGDSLHPRENVSKMAASTPLTDEDRWPWLTTVGHTLASARSTGIVVACSALKRVYRNAIVSEAAGVAFLQLNGTREALLRRLEDRIGHFMPVGLLDSQLATLEPLQQDECGVIVNIEAGIDDIVAGSVASVQERFGRFAPTPPRVVDRRSPTLSSSASSARTLTRPRFLRCTSPPNPT